MVNPAAVLFFLSLCVYWVPRYDGIVNRWAGPLIHFSPLAKLIFTIVPSVIKVTAYNSSVGLRFCYVVVRELSDKVLDILLRRIFTLFWSSDIKWF